MTTRSVSAAFTTNADAESARQQLTGMGVAADAIHILVQRSPNYGPNRSRAPTARWLAAVRRMFVAREPRNAPALAISRNTFVLTASVAEDLVAAVVVVLESSSAIELDEHQKLWRKNIWRGSAAARAAIDEHATRAATGPATRVAKPLEGRELG